MIFFNSRIDAGQKLAAKLQAFKNKNNTIIIALPRGGVVVGKELSLALQLPLDIVVPRKIGAPDNLEFAIGAITETGEGIFSEETIRTLGISKEYLQKTVEEERKKAQWRLTHYRQERKKRELADKTVILVDDGVATGSTLRAAIKTVIAERAKEVIVAIPVAPPDTLKKLKKEVDAVYCLHSPLNFYAVGQFYEQFEQTSDEEVIEILKSTNDY